MIISLNYFGTRRTRNGCSGVASSVLARVGMTEINNLATVSVRVERAVARSGTDKQKTNI